MPATQTFPASPRQISFINDLRRERGMEPLDELTASHLTGGRTGSASRAISELQAMPRSAATGTARRGNTAVATPRNDTRAGRMLNAGGIDATVTLPNGDHVTLLISTRVPRGRGWANGAPTDNGARTNIKVLGRRIGWVNVDNGAWSINVRNSTVRAAVDALFCAAAGLGTGDYRVQEASRCGRCRRTLTDPVSIDRGIGPECWGRCTGSHHADVRGAVASSVRFDEAGDVVVGRGGRTAAESDAIARQDAEHDAEFARREREQEERAFASDPDYRATHEALNMVTDAMVAVAPAAQRATRAGSAVRVTEARALIERALKALAEDELAEPGEVRRALATFDQLAGR